jgi:phosphatidylglycerophosphatase A
MTQSLMPTNKALQLHAASWRFMFKHPAHVIALGFGSGLSSIAPGTVGTLWAWITFTLIDSRIQLYQYSDVIWALVLVISLLAGWWACTATAKRLKISDPGCIVWDEIIAFWWVLWWLGPSSFTAQLSAFVLFRFFDAAKLGPVAWADKLFKLPSSSDKQSLFTSGWAQGFGIIWDDLVAAFCTLLIIAIYRSI